MTYSENNKRNKQYEKVTHKNSETTNSPIIYKKNEFY